MLRPTQFVCFVVKFDRVFPTHEIRLIYGSRMAATANLACRRVRGFFRVLS